MTETAADSQRLGDQFLASLDKTRLGAAASKLYTASIGEIVTIFSRSQAHKHYSLADIEWLILPAVAAGQFYVVEAAHKEHGVRVPIAVVTWASVSEEVDRRLQDDLSKKTRLRPDEWKSGEIGWIIDIVGSGAAVREALDWLKRGPLKDKSTKLVVRDSQGRMRVGTLERPANSLPLGKLAR